MKSNRLKINCDKTECISMCTKQRQKNSTVPVLQVAGSTVQPTDGARNLGVFFYNHLDLKSTFLM